MRSADDMTNPLAALAAPEGLGAACSGAAERGAAPSNQES
jgi:hypothetical protein